MMPLLDKLLPRTRKRSRDGCAERLVLRSSARTSAENDGDYVLCLGADQVRILLFRECEWRGRKLLFDSMTLQKQRSKSEIVERAAASNNAEGKCEAPFNIGTARDLEPEKTAEDDVNLLSEMVFGTVAMMYRGSSFKVHSMNSPPCIMCAKIFSATEHGTCKPSERVSDEGLGRSVRVDSASSNASTRSFLSQPSSGNLSGNDLHATPRKNSTCSSLGSGWDIDIAAPTGSSQSLESNGSSGIGSLSSLRRRWLRAISTSLGRSDSDDSAFGMQHWGENGSDGRDGYAKRHKTRLGLAMLVRLAQGHESKIETQLLEHMALLEGMLDRLRYFCIEIGNFHGLGCKGMQLTDRICRATSRFVVSLLQALLNVQSDAGSRAPLLWHDVLLHSVTVKVNTDTLRRSLHQMCELFDELDTKSTNFFLSTVVTAVLTYHLGWVYTVLSPRDRQMMEKLGSWYSCNPLWAQLGDLYGALGNPAKVAHTVIAGDPRKGELINSVLSFLSYFIRSGVIEKRREYRCSSERDLQEAVGLLEQARSKRPYLFSGRRSTCAFNERETSGGLVRRGDGESRKPPSIRSPDGGTDVNAPRYIAVSRYPAERPRISRSDSPFKRSGTVKSDLDALMTKSSAEATDLKLPTKRASRESRDASKYESLSDDRSDEGLASSKVKIIVSEIGEPQEDTLAKESQRDHPSQYPRTSFGKKLDADAEESLATGHNVHPLKMYFSRPEYPLNAEGEFAADEGKESSPQVFFTLGGGEDKSAKASRLGGSNCQCSYTFTRVPSTSAQLPEGVLRKIIQRNFPESSKSMEPPPGARSVGFCLRCNGQGYAQDYDGSKQVLETPTNATEVLRTCGSSVGDRNVVRMSKSSSLEALMEANSVVELPMPRSRKISSSKTGSAEEMGFTRTLLQNRITNDETNVLDTGYTWGLVLQGMIKKKKRRKKKSADETDKSETEPRENWWSCMREEVAASARFPTIDQPVAEALCVLADLDTWHVGILSNNAPWQNPPLPVGMSRLVSNMLESFAYVWRKYHSPTYCVAILEAKLRELWLRSEALAEMMMSVEECDANVNSLTNALDLDAADIPLLLAVATTHSPEIAQRYGLTLT
ncbi:PREDICTED: folliculin-interacting protein 2 [Dinoponera quadriceps]|uniref:Folliculin-interacting protein 2 n=1 Tax=Dinoponera quadriceps TaxID=609295 RepID=A0A6P3XRM1_DINQU|nr:PREDICTED: folliculin-interacting protein 2 [Dinoponera quadriceps]